MSTTRDSLDVRQLYKDALTTDSRIFGTQFFGEFLNWGYWRAHAASQREACEKPGRAGARSLTDESGSGTPETGCGIGSVAKYLSRYFAPADISGINGVDDQLLACRERVPAAQFLKMDAARMSFPDDSFDVVISVESAFHYDTREQFFAEARRVLKPGGYLAVADIITVPLEGKKNFAADPGEYGVQLRAAGFTETRVEDVTAETIWSHTDFSIAYLDSLLAEGKITPAEYESGALSRVARLTASRFYIVAGARKPPAHLPAWRKNNAAGSYLNSLLARTASA